MALSVMANCLLALLVKSQGGQASVQVPMTNLQRGKRGG